MSVRRKRRTPQDGEFEDPLKKYDAPDYQDDLERALMESTVDRMKIEPFISMPPYATVEQVMAEMARLDVACVLIVENDRLLGIFSERDVLRRIADCFEQVKDKTVGEVMTRDPSFVHHTDSPAKALNLMAVSGFRHLPILNVDDKVVGILGPRRVTTYLREYIKG